MCGYKTQADSSLETRLPHYLYRTLRGTFAWCYRVHPLYPCRPQRCSHNRPSLVTGRLNCVLLIATNSVVICTVMQGQDSLLFYRRLRETALKHKKVRMLHAKLKKKYYSIIEYILSNFEVDKQTCDKAEKAADLNPTNYHRCSDWFWFES